MPSLSLWDKKLSQYELVPFTSELERQHDADVECLPYSISPFSVLEIAKNWPHGDVEIGSDILFSPTSIKPTLVWVIPSPVYHLITTSSPDGGLSRSDPVIFCAVPNEPCKPRTATGRYNNHGSLFKESESHISPHTQLAKTYTGAHLCTQVPRAATSAHSECARKTPAPYH